MGRCKRPSRLRTPRGPAFLVLPVIASCGDAGQSLWCVVFGEFMPFHKTFFRHNATARPTPISTMQLPSGQKHQGHAGPRPFRQTPVGTGLITNSDLCEAFGG